MNLFQCEDCSTTVARLEVQAFDAPNVVFTPQALKWIKAIVEIHDEEVGFFGIVEEYANRTFAITEIFYNNHNYANGATCETSAAGDFEIFDILDKRGKFEDHPKVKFWGHSHHTMGVSASVQDQAQAIKKINEGRTYLIRAICNKHMKMSVSFFDFDQGVQYDHLKWGILAGTNESVEKLKKATDTIARNDISPEKKIDAIKKIFDNDEEYEDIVKKVKALKERNMPKEKIASTDNLMDYCNRLTAPSMSSVFGDPNNQDAWEFPYGL